MEDNNLEGAEVQTDAVSDDVQVEASPSWDGSLDSLVGQPWVPEDAREHLTRHLDDYTSTRTRADFLSRMFEADDRTAELSKELDSLRQAMDAASKERDEWKGRATEYETRFAEVEDDREFERLKAAHPDIYADCHEDANNPEGFTGAWPMMLDLMVRGYDEATAAKLARAMIATGAGSSAAPAQVEAFVPEQSQQKVLPPSIRAASRGGNNPSSTVNAAEANESFDQRVRRLMAEARDRGE